MSLPQQMMHPELMVIGDSLAQGCRSLTVNAALCQQSWAARVAASQKWQFATPDFPRSILFDLEYEVRHLGELVNVAPSAITVGGFVTRIIENMRAWLMNKRESRHICFDNLGLAGAKISDVLERTAASSDDYVRKQFPNGAAGSVHLPIHTIGDLHIAINGRFTLNPSQDPVYEQFTPMEWVRQRLPKRLFVQIGHNHGLYSIGADGKNVPFDGTDQNGKTFLESFQQLADELGKLPNDVKKIVCCLLPKIGAVANLQPQDSSRAAGYADSYEPIFSTSKAILTGRQLSEIDTAIRNTNLELNQMLANAISGDRLLCIDTYSFFDAHDYKNTLDPAKRVAVEAGTAIDNFYLHGKLMPQFPPKIGVPPFMKKLARGGFQNIDGMHPSGCGYAILAAVVIDALGLNKNPDLVKRGYLEDPLLHDFPLKLDLLILVLAQLRKALVMEAVSVPETNVISDVQEDLHIADAITLMKQVMLR
jgi:hypothetical protein